MTPTFAQNSRMFQHTQSIHIAVLKLSMAGYIALKATTTDHQVNIQIDKPFEGVEPTIQKHAEKTIASCEFHQCRLWWHVEPIETKL